MGKLHLQMQWYTRRGGVIRGPFSADEITRHFILGRIGLDDELSQDCLSWAAASQCSELLPGELQNLSSWDDYQQLLVIRMQVDERQGKRRGRQGSNHCGDQPGRRTLADRRGKNNDPLLSQLRYSRTCSPRINALPRKNLRTLLITIVLATIVLAWLVPSQR